MGFSLTPLNFLQGTSSFAESINLRHPGAGAPRGSAAGNAPWPWAALLLQGQPAQATGSVTYRRATGTSEGQAARRDRRTMSAPAIRRERAAASRSTSDEADWLHSSSAAHHRSTSGPSSSPNLPEASEAEGIQAHLPTPSGGPKATCCPEITGPRHKAVIYRREVTALFPARTKEKSPGRVRQSPPAAAGTYQRASSRLAAHSAWKRRSGSGHSASTVCSSISRHAAEEPWSLGEASWDHDEGSL